MGKCDCLDHVKALTRLLIEEAERDPDVPIDPVTGIVTPPLATLAKKLRELHDRMEYGK